MDCEAVDCKAAALQVVLGSTRGFAVDHFVARCSAVENQPLNYLT